MLKLLATTDAASALLAEIRLADGDTQPLAVSRFELRPGLWSVEAYFDAAPPDDVIERMSEGLAFAEPPTLIEVPQQNWVAHVESVLRPVTAGRFLVHGPHDRHRAEGHPFAIEIEAGGAFGTAHHETTRGCLLAIDRHAEASARALDLGTGSGVLAIAIAKLCSADVLASDIDAAAIDIARANFARNGVDGQVAAIVADGLDHPVIAAAAPFDLVVANILAEPLIALAPAVVAVLAPGRRLVLSGLLDHQAEVVRAAYADAGARFDEVIGLEGWSTLVMTRAA